MKKTILLVLLVLFIFISPALSIECPYGTHECIIEYEGELVETCCDNSSSNGPRGALDTDNLLAKRDEYQYHGYGLTEREQILTRCENNCDDGQYACSDYCYHTYEDSDGVDRCQAACRAREAACKNNCL